MHLGTTHEGGVFLDRKGLVHMRTSVTRRRNNTMPMSMPPILCFKDFPKISTSSSITNIRSKSNLGQRHMLKAGSELTIEDRESQLYDEFERFKMLPDNRISKNYSDGGFCSECSRETESELEPKHSQNSDYFKDKMLLMQAQENGTVLDEEELLFLNDECDAFDSDVDDEPTAQSGQQIHKLVHPMHQSYLSNVTPYEQYLSDNDIFGVPSCASSALSSMYDQKTKTALVCGELELAEATRNKLYVKMNDYVCVEKRGIPPKVLPTKQWKPTGRLLPLGRQCPLVRSTALKSDCLPADPQEPVAPVAYNLACTNQPDRNCNWGSNVSNSPFSPLFKCRNFGKKCLFGTVRFGNDHFGAIMRYVDYVIDLEVAFRKHTCFVQDLDGVDRIKGSRGMNLYTIFVEDMYVVIPFAYCLKPLRTNPGYGHSRTFRELSAEMGLLNEESHLLKLLGYVIFSKASIVFFGAAAVAGQRYKGAWRISGISPVCFN
ncbi:hypothetical protein Tco_1408473 [Tanacetum coccineum]